MAASSFCFCFLQLLDRRSCPILSDRQEHRLHHIAYRAQGDMHQLHNGNLVLGATEARG